MNRKTILGLTAAVVGALGTIACGGAGPNGGGIPAPEGSNTATSSKSTGGSGAANSLMSGTLEVGKDVKPGTYSTAAGESSFGCYWARLRNFDGEMDSIIANGNVEPGQRGRFTVKKSDKGLELNGDCVWKRS